MVKQRNPKDVIHQGALLPDVAERIVGDNRDKIWHIYKKVPEISNDDQLLQLCFWEEFDGLKEALADKYDDFVEWYMHKATNAEAIRRSRQSMTEHGHLPQRESIKEKRTWLSGVWRKYWGPYR